MASISRNAELARYFAQIYPGVPRTRLVKLIYLADLIAREYLSRPISEFRYQFHHRGPYDAAIEHAVAELEGRDLAWQSDDRSGEVRFKRLYPNGAPLAWSFTLGENEILGYVSSNYVRMPMNELLDDVVYESHPMKVAERRFIPLDMDSVNGRGTRAAGFDLEAVLRAERQAEAGDYKTLRTFGDELRAAITARHSA